MNDQQGDRYIPHQASGESGPQGWWREGYHHLVLHINHFLTLEEGRFFLWLPVFTGVGIGICFALPFEPTGAFTGLLFAGVLLVAGISMRRGLPFIVAMMLVTTAGGFALAKIRTEMVRAPVLQKAKGVYLVEALLDQVTPLPGNRKQLYLSRIKISGLPAGRTPGRLRITSHIRDKPLFVGARIRVRAVLRPPPGPVRPDGFDFARQAWFEGIGGVGFAISRVKILEGREANTFAVARERFRRFIARKIRAVVRGPGGDIAVALIVGEKRSIDKDVLAAIRDAGLAHMLAISGMHMALVAGTVYWVLRALLALWQWLALAMDVRKIAAVGAILVAGSYYMLSGMGISTLRAFIMVTIMFVAVIAGRNALSLRNVSIAALLILIFRPESLLEVGFQMSFASVVALISFYETGFLQPRNPGSTFAVMRILEKTARAGLAILATTVVAGLAVAPIAVYHFHHMTPWSVIGNILALPILSLIVMPLALAGLIAMPFGLHEAPLYLMGQGNALIVSIARFVSGFAEARVNVGTISHNALLVMIAGGLWLCLWRSRYRYGGLALIICGLLLSLNRPVPFLLVERGGKNLVLIDENRNMWPMSMRSGRYSLEKWQSAFATRAPARGKRTGRQEKWRCDALGCTALFQGQTIAWSAHPGALFEDCQKADILVASYPVPKSFSACQHVKIIIDSKALRRNGAYALYRKNNGLKIVNSRETRGSRPWVRNSL